MATNKSLQLLRNTTTIYATLEAAKSALEAKVADVQDGVAILGRYSGATEGTIETVLGVVHKGVGDTNGITFFLNSVSIKEQLEALETEVNTIETAVGLGTDGSHQTSTGNYTSEATTIEGEIVALDSQVKANADDIAEIQTAISGMDATSVSGESKVVIDVTETDGVVTATAANLTGVKLDGYAEGSDAVIAATDTLGEALGKLQGQIKAMDLAEVGGADGSVITAVSEADGKVSAVVSALSDVKLAGFEANTGTTGDVTSTDSVEDAINKLNNKIVASTTAASVKNTDGSITVVEPQGQQDSGTTISVNIKSGEHVLAKDGNAGLYTDLDLVKITTGLPETVKERYQLLATDDSQIGVNIDVPKDSHIVSINYITDTGDTHYQNLEYVYIDASGETQTTYVDMSELVIEAEFENGVEATDGVVHGVVDPTSESFLTVGADGFKVAGVSGFVQSEIEKLDATGGTQTIAAGKHVAVEVIEADGKITTVNVAEDDIASASALTAEIAARKAVDGQNGDTYAANGSANYISNATSLNDADVKLDAQLKAEQDEIDAIETAVGLNADGTYSPNTANHYTSASTSIQDAIDDLDTQVAANTEAIAQLSSGTTDLIEELSGKAVTVIASTDGSLSATSATATDGTVSYDLHTDASMIKMTGFNPVATTADTAPAATDTVAEAVSKIYAIAKHHHLSGSSAIDVAQTTDGATVSLVLADNTTSTTAHAQYAGGQGNDNVLEIVEGDGLYLDSTWDCGTF